MNFDWTHYFILAKKLAGWSITVPIDNDANLRSAISRAYYAAFHEVDKFLAIDKFPGGGQRHAAIIQYLQSNQDRNLNKIGNNLNRLRSDRNKADYYDTVPDLKNQTNSAIKTAERIFLDLSTFSNP